MFLLLPPVLLLRLRVFVGSLFHKRWSNSEQDVGSDPAGKVAAGHFSNDSPSSNRRGERAQRASEAPRDIHACCVDARAALAALALLLLVVLAPPQSYTLAVLMLLPL